MEFKKVKWLFNNSSSYWLNYNKKWRFMQISLVLTAFVIVMSFNLPVSHEYSLLTLTPVGLTPNGIAFDPATGNVYVANYGDGTVSVINGATGSTIAIPVGGHPLYVAVGNGNVYVSNPGSNSISVISDTSNTVTSTIPVSNPSSVAFDPTTGKVYVASYLANTVSVISGNSVTSPPITVNTIPSGIAVGNGNVFVANFYGNSISVISDTSNTVTSTITVGNYPSGVAFDPTTGKVYVANYADNAVSVISGNSVTSSPIKVGGNPIGVAVGNGNVFVANSASNNISVISDTSNNVTSTIGGVTNPTWLAFDSSKSNIYASETYQNSVAVISSSNPIISTPPPLPTIGPGVIPGVITDTTPPIFAAPSDISLFPTSTLGAIVSYTVSATDETGIPTVRCDHTSGSQFPIGTTPVTCIAFDSDSTQQATLTFKVKVYTPIEGAQVMVGQLNNINALSSGTITSLDSKLPFEVTLMPGNNGAVKDKLNNFINEITAKCCDGSGSKPFTLDQGNKFTTEAKDIVAATP